MKCNVLKWIALGLLFSTSLSAAPACPHFTTGAQVQQEGEQAVIDSDLSFEDAIGNLRIPALIKKQLRLVGVRYYSFDGKIHQGQLVIHKSLVREIVEIFREIKENRFPIAKVIPISKYDYSDEASMLDNNTSAFNYRPIEGSGVLSNHSFGMAVDINPFLNPVLQGKKVNPKGATYNPRLEGTLTKDGAIVRAFKKRGWRWGGDWKRKIDYQHFEKRLAL